jgi:predicted phage terminase large subunit-like protein
VSLPALPAGWEDWPPAKKLELLELHRQAKDDAPRKAWLSCRLDCDGQPHPGLPYKHARPGQRPPEPGWALWLLLAGRGYGKTRTGSEWAWRKARTEPRGALVAPTAGDARDVMVEGESGIMAVVPSVFRPKYEPSKRRLTYPNGAQQAVYSADEPDRLRGPQHNYSWCDELAAWKSLPEAWSNLELGLRLGDSPEVLATTTPRPKKLIVELAHADTTHITRGTTYENLTNLAETFKRNVLAKYEGTRTGRQELMAELLTDVEGALWTLDLLEQTRVEQVRVPDLKRVVVAIDPAVTSGEDSDSTGISVVGQGVDGETYVLADLTTRDTPDGWARRAVAAYETYGADAIVAEVNNGGDLVESVVRTVDRRARYRAVRASRGKRVRAEPVAALWEQHRAHIVGSQPELEEQMTTWTPDSGSSPDRMDAMVWGVTEVALTKKGGYASVA